MNNEEKIQVQQFNHNQKITSSHKKALATYFNQKAKALHSNEADYGYYLNGMSNSKELSKEIDTKHDFVLNRATHGQANLTYISYGVDHEGNGKDYKHFDERIWYYAIFNRESDKVQIRQDLINSWVSTNIKPYVLVVSDSGIVWDIPATYFFKEKGKIKWNKEGNLVKTFELGKPTFELGNTVPCEKEVEWVNECLENIGHANYAKHRISKSGMITVAMYKDGKRKSFHNMKSLKQIYDLLHFDNLGSYKSFQRLVKLNGLVVSQFLKNKNGEVFFVSIGTVPPEEYIEGQLQIDRTVYVANLAAEALEESNLEPDNVEDSITAAVDHYIIDATDIEKVPEKNIDIGKMQVEKITSSSPARISSRIDPFVDFVEKQDNLAETKPKRGPGVVWAIERKKI